MDGPKKQIQCAQDVSSACALGASWVKRTFYKIENVNVLR